MFYFIKSDSIEYDNTFMFLKKLLIFKKGRNIYEYRRNDCSTSAECT